MTKTALRLTLLGAALAAASCRGAPTWARLAEPTQVTTTVAIPTSWDLGIPVVEAWIDGRGPFRFMLDSGASAVFVDRRVAEELKLELVHLTSDGAGTQTFHTGEGTVSLSHAARIRELRAGPLVDRDRAAVVGDLTLFARALGGRVDGVLPAQMFRGGLLTLDHGGGDATFAPGELPPADGQQVLAIRFDDLCWVGMDVGGNRFLVLIDTGSDGFLTVPAGLEASLRFRAPPAIVGRSATLAGITPRRVARVDGTLAWGACALADPVVELSTTQYGNAGIELVREFRVTFDFTNRRVRFERAGGEPIRSPPVRSAGTGFLHDDGAWTVAYVLEGGPAERAELREGDRVEAIDGRPVGEIGIVEREKLLATRDSVTLRVVRDGTARDVVVDVATLVE